MGAEQGARRDALAEIAIDMGQMAKDFAARAIANQLPYSRQVIEFGRGDGDQSTMNLRTDTPVFDVVIGNGLHGAPLYEIDATKRWTRYSLGSGSVSATGEDPIDVGLDHLREVWNDRDYDIRYLEAGLVVTAAGTLLRAVRSGHNRDPEAIVSHCPLFTGYRSEYYPTPDDSGLFFDPHERPAVVLAQLRERLDVEYAALQASSVELRKKSALHGEVYPPNSPGYYQPTTEVIGAVKGSTITAGGGRGLKGAVAKLLGRS